MRLVRGKKWNGNGLMRSPLDVYFRTVVFCPQMLQSPILDVPDCLFAGQTWLSPPLYPTDHCIVVKMQVGPLSCLPQKRSLAVPTNYSNVSAHRFRCAVVFTHRGDCGERPRPPASPHPWQQARPGSGTSGRPPHPETILGCRPWPRSRVPQPLHQPSGLPC